MSITSTIRNKVTDWYRGTYVPPFENDPNSSIVFISTGFYVQPRLARILGAIGRFIAAEWKWLLGFAVAVLALYANFVLKH